MGIGLCRKRLLMLLFHLESFPQRKMEEVANEQIS